jgi:hypothetical protein
VDTNSPTSDAEEEGFPVEEQEADVEFELPDLDDAPIVEHVDVDDHAPEDDEEEEPEEGPGG